MPLGTHDHGDEGACTCLTPQARTRLLGEGPVDANALHEIGNAPPLFRIWFFQRLGLMLPPASCSRHPDLPLSPHVDKKGRVSYRYVVRELYQQLQ